MPADIRITLVPADITITLDSSGRARAYAHGVMLRGVKAIVANPGGDVLLVLDREAVLVDLASTPAPEQDLAPVGPLATDGNA